MKKLTKEQRLRRKIAAEARPRKMVFPRPKPQMVTVTLHAKHSLNHQHYGPGTVTVPRPVAEVLLEGERNVEREVQRFRDTEPLSVLIGGRQRVYRLPPEQFEAAFNTGSVLAGAVQGRAS